MNYKGYASKRSKNMPTASYFYLEKQVEKFIMSRQNMSNLRGLIRTQNIST